MKYFRLIRLNDWVTNFLLIIPDFYVRHFPGYPPGKGIFASLYYLNDMKSYYGGRLCLGKDTCMKANMPEKSYPDPEKFRMVIGKFNPENLFGSKLTERLKVTYV